MRLIVLMFLFLPLSAQDFAKEIVDAGQFLNARNLCPATSGNFSVRVGDLVAITVSGKHKGYLSEDDVMLVNLNGKPVNNNKRPSAETLLHTKLYAQFDGIGAVLHTHSLNGTVLSMLYEDELVTEGYEIHKIFPGIKTHDSTVVIPIFENTQDIELLSEEVYDYLAENPHCFGYLIRGHGFYTWGRDMNEAKFRIEAFEYLFETELKLLSIVGQFN